MKKYGFNTTLVQNTTPELKNVNPSQIPIYMTASYTFENAEDIEAVFNDKKFGYIYTRISNPTIAAFEKKLNLLEDGIGCLSTSSGMAAISSVVISLLEPEKEILCSDSLFGGTIELFNEVIKKFGIDVKYINICDIKEIKRNISNRTSLIFLETISNPKLSVPDIKKISQLAHNYNVPVVADSTVTTPYMLYGKNSGADIIVYSTTKYLTGNGSLIGGAVIDTGRFDWLSYNNHNIREWCHKAGQHGFLLNLRKNIHQNFGGCTSPFNAYLQNIGIETLGIRMQRHCDNALKLSRFLDSHKKVRKVNYPGLETHPYHKISKKQFNNKFGGILTIELADKQSCFKLINNLRLVKCQANLGDTKTLIIHPASTIFHSFTSSDMEKAGVNQQLLRISVGIEDIEDIIDDFDVVLKQI